MGKLQEFEPEKLILGVIFHDEEVFRAAMKKMTDAFGEIEDASEEFSFSKEFSTYYDGEIGGEGRRIIFSFKALVDPTRQAEIKTFTNSVEAEFSVDGDRKINLDPGFMNTGRVMLATTKPAGFRVPLSDGIYTEVTLFYAKHAFHPLPWTYMDYQSEKVGKFLLRVHAAYLADRKRAGIGQKR